MEIKRDKLIKYLSIILLVAFCLVPVIWFLGRPGVLIDGSDTNFPLDPLIWFKRRFFVWNDVSNAGTNFSSSIAGIVFHLVQVIPFLLKFDLQAVEITSLVFWFSTIVFSSYVFAKVIFPEKILPRLIFVLFYSFNIYLFNSWENIKVANLALVAFLPLSISILISYINKRVSTGRAVVYSTVCGLLAAGSGINPAYFITIILGIFITAVVESFVNFDKRKLKIVWTGFVLVVSSMILVNSFWIFPTANHLLFSEKKITNLKDIGYTNWLDSLSENTSLVNVLRLQGAWDWYSADDSGAPLYIPYSVNYFRSLPFIVFSFLMTGAAFASLIFRKKGGERFYVIFAVMLVLGTFLGAGGHAPTGTIYRFLSTHLPFFSFFRSPWYIFTPLLTLSLAGLISMLFDLVSGKVSPRFTYMLFAGILISNMLYNYPLVTGKIFRPASKDNFYIKFPGYVFDSKSWLLSAPEGRVIGYPDDEIERFDWGYNAVETVLSIFSERETLFSSLSDTEAPLALLMKQYNLGLKKREVGASYSIASKLNVRHIMDKADQSSLAPQLPDGIKALDSTTFGQWSFYKIPDSVYTPKIFTSAGTYFVYPFERADSAATLIPGKDLIISPNDSVINTVENLQNAGGRVVVATNTQDREANDFFVSPNTFSSRAIERDLSNAVFVFDIPADDNYKIVLENYKLFDFGITAGADLGVLLDGKEVVLKAEKTDDSYVYFAPVSLTSGRHEISVGLKHENLAKKTTLPASDTRSKNALAVYSIDNFDPMLNYLIKLNYRHISGDYPALIVEQHTATDPVKRKTEYLPLFPETIPFGFFFDPVRTDSTAKLIIETPYLTDPLGTRIEYSDVVINKVFSNKLMLVRENNPEVLSAPEVKFDKVSAVEYRGSVMAGDKPHVLVFSENYSPDWEIEMTGAGGSSVPTRPLHFSVNLYANGWYIAGAPKDYTFRIYYKPQRVFYAGLAATGMFILSSAAYFVWETVKKKNEKNN